MANLIGSVEILVQLIQTVKACGAVCKFAAHAVPLVIDKYRFVPYLSEYKITMKLILPTVRG
jgi:hypothetical protein